MIKKTALKDLLPLIERYENLSLQKIKDANHSNTYQHALTKIIAHATIMVDW